MHLTRREFLKGSFGASTVLAFSSAVPGFLARTSRAATTARNTSSSVLVVLQLSGGNDGLNTVVPYGDDAYQRSRPTLRLDASDLHKLGSGLGLHPEMPAFLRLYHEGHLSIVQGVGYPHSKRDHGTAMRDWHTAQPERTPEAGQGSFGPVETGWLGRACDLACETGETRDAGPKESLQHEPVDLAGAFVGDIKMPFGLQAERIVVPSVHSLDQWRLALNPGRAASAAFEQRLAKPAKAGQGREPNPLLEFVRQSTLRTCDSSRRIGELLRQDATAAPAGYPSFPLAQTLKAVAQLIRTELGLRIFFVELGGGGIGGFDTHAGQAANHGALLRELSESVAAFLDDLQRDHLLDSTLLITFSEFGRTLTENGRRGTGHGAAAPMFVAGGKVAGGLVGPHPSLTDLEADAPKFHTDFRRVYATVLDQWLGFDSQAILGAKFAPLPGLIR